MISDVKVTSSYFSVPLRHIVANGNNSGTRMLFHVGTVTGDICKFKLYALPRAESKW